MASDKLKQMMNQAISMEIQVSIQYMAACTWSGVKTWSPNNWRTSLFRR